MTTEKTLTITVSHRALYNILDMAERGLEDAEEYANYLRKCGGAYSDAEAVALADAVPAMAAHLDAFRSAITTAEARA